jgi:phosphomannomutase
MNPQIFKAYDVRGIYPTELDEQIFRQIGRAFVAYLKAKQIGVGRDMRLSSPSLSEAFIEGAREQGADVIDYGMIATDMIYYAVGTDALDGGAQITASHNPKQYNGCKMVGRGNIPLSGDAGISDIRDMIAANAIPAASQTPGSLTRRDILDGYVGHVLRFIDPSAIKAFRVILDAGCGMAGLVAPPMFRALPCKTESLCFTVDGTFPTHEANPLIEENRRDIVARVQAQRAEIGIAWDGDADRCFFIDEDGEFIAGDFVTALLAEAFLLKEPGTTIIYDLRASHAVKDMAAKYAGKAVMNRVGHAFFKAKMRELNASFGGEVTGHYYFRENFYCDNGFIPALLMLELMSKKNQSLKQMLEPLRAKYFISGEINTKMATMEAMAERMAAIESRFRDGKIYRLDGVSVEYPDWHFNVRPSNTEPLLRLNLEASTPQQMERKRNEVLSIIRDAAPSAPTPSTRSA